MNVCTVLPQANPCCASLFYLKAKPLFLIMWSVFYCCMSYLNRLTCRDVLKVINWGFSHHWFAFENLPNFHLKFVTFARKAYKRNIFASFKTKKENFFLLIQLHNCCWCSCDYISLQLCIVCWSAPASRYFKHLISTSFISTVFFRCIFEKKKTSSLFFTFAKAWRDVCAAIWTWIIS